jgi:putative oxidoreductase
MKIATIVVRVLMGALLVFASVTYFFDLMPQPTQTGAIATVMGGFAASKYIFPLSKAIELLSGISFLSGKYMRLFNLVLLPITVNIFLIHVFLEPLSELPMALFLLLGNVFFIYKNWDSYKQIFVA